MFQLVLQRDAECDLDTSHPHSLLLRGRFCLYACGLRFAEGFHTGILLQLIYLHNPSIPFAEKQAEARFTPKSH